MKGTYILAGFFALILCIPAAFSDAPITGDATSQQTGISILVIATVPSLTIISPRNETYLTNTSILLNFSVSGQLLLWYNLDNGNNITITQPLYFNTSQGSHILYLFANNSEGLTRKNITFSVNITRFRVIYEEYRGSFKGNSTNFNLSTYEQLQNLTNIVLEETRYGRISFFQNINVTNSQNPASLTTDLDTNTNISTNRIEINGTALPNFNTSMTLSLYNISFTTPRILKNGDVCSSSVCIQQGYASGTFVFNVTEAALYSAEETPAQQGSTPNTGSSTSGGSSSTTGGITKNLEIDPEQLSISLKQGEIKTRSMKITNTGNTPSHIIVKAQKLGNLVRIDEESLDLQPGQARTVSIDFIAKEDQLPGPYLGKIVVFDGAADHEVLIIIDVQSKNPLFDIKTEILKSSLYVQPGDDVVGQITLYSLGSQGTVDVLVDYTILDNNGNEILVDHETLAVQTQTSFVKKFTLPAGISKGTYILNVKATYSGETASSSAWFFVGIKPWTLQDTLLYAILLLLLLGTIIIIYDRRNRTNKTKKFGEIELVQAGMVRDH
ncbi:hypothetical protein KW805_02365 [Candidatus Pacearchaeota archaeon]|nr:hypothetical protein [Candidatus Pacearchaeota archaeon]